MSAQKSTSSGLGLGTILFIVFLILKLTGHISWSWVWVTSPLWIPLVLGGGVILIGAILMYFISQKN